MITVCAIQSHHASSRFGIDKSTNVHDLPQEILTIIFVLASNESNAQQPALMMVCRSWKELALAIPHLWDSLSLHPPHIFSTLTFAKIAIWFQRANQKPLTLKIGRHPVHHWRSSDVEMQIPWSNITNLQLYDQYSLSLQMARQVLALSPKLEVCRFSGVQGCNEDLINEMVAHWNDKPLTLPHLRVLSLGFDSDLPEDDETLETCTSPESRCPTFIFPFFDSLKLPSLEELAIEASESAQDDDLMDTLAALYDRSGFNLKSFKIVNVVTDNVELWTFLVKTPELGYLHLETQYGSTESYYLHLAALRFQPSVSFYPLPMLHKLAILDISPPASSRTCDEAVLKFLESRWWKEGDCPYNHDQKGLSQLKDVLFYWGAGSDCPEKANFHRLQEIRDEGLLMFYPSMSMARQPGSTLDRPVNRAIHSFDEIVGSCGSSL